MSIAVDRDRAFLESITSIAEAAPIPMRFVSKSAEFAFVENALTKRFRT